MDSIDSSCVTMGGVDSIDSSCVTMGGVEVGVVLFCGGGKFLLFFEC